MNAATARFPHVFLGLEEEHPDLDAAAAVIFPVPYEATTSWGGGAAEGPAAILEASRYVELFDQELGEAPYRAGIHTLPAPSLSREGPGVALDELERAYRRILEGAPGAWPVMVGGEHSITAPAVRAHAGRAGRDLTVLQLDAHADLRAEYGGTVHSHASVMRRVLEDVGGVEVVAVGVRGISEEERAFADGRDDVAIFYAEEMAQGDVWVERALAALRPSIYLTFDVDFFDPSLVPSTGTPEPGGGEWYPTLRFLRRVFREREVLACDVVEHAPIPGLRAPDFLVAKLIYKLIAYRFEGGR